MLRQISEKIDIVKFLFFIFLLLFFSAQACSQNTVVQDGKITTAIKEKILLDKSFSNLKINVSTHDGIVVLTGKVNSDADASELIEIAQSTTGVKDIDISDLIIADSKQPLLDLFITAKIKGMLIQNKIFTEDEIAEMDIHVETNNAIVYLTGDADNKEQIDHAIRVSKSVPGVKAVDSRVEIRK